MNKISSSYQILTEFLKFFEGAKATLKEPWLLSQGISASEFYQLITDLCVELLSLIKEEHYHRPRFNPRVKVLRDQVDEIGNTDVILTIPDRRDLTVSGPLETKALELIIQDLISLKRNRRPTRSRTMPCVPKKERKVKSSRRKRKRGFLYD